MSGKRKKLPKNVHAQRQNQRAKVRGRAFANLKRDEKDALLLALLQHFGLADEQGVLK